MGHEYNATSLAELATALEDYLVRAGEARHDQLGMWLLTGGTFSFFVHTASAFFKAGSANGAGVLRCTYQNFLILALIPLTWWVAGFAEVYEPGSVFVGDRGSRFLYGTAAEAAHRLSYESAHFYATLYFATGAITAACDAASGRLTVQAIIFLTVLLSIFPYPAAAHWVTSHGGWLNPHYESHVGTGVIDGGYLVMNIFGGVCGLVMCVMFPKSERRRGHNTFFIGCGVLMTWFSVYGFLGYGSQALQATEGAPVLVTFTLGVAVAAVTSTALSREVFEFYDVEHLLGSTLAGISALSISAVTIRTQFAPVVGAVAALLFHSVHTLDTQQLDRLHSIAARLVPAVWGGFAGVLFKRDDVLPGKPMLEALGSVALAIVVIAAWAAFWMVVCMLAIKHLFGWEVQKDEIEHGAHFACIGADDESTDVETEYSYRSDPYPTTEWTETNDKTTDNITPPANRLHQYAVRTSAVRTNTEDQSTVHWSPRGPKEMTGVRVHPLKAGSFLSSVGERLEDARSYWWVLRLVFYFALVGASTVAADNVEHVNDFSLNLANETFSELVTRMQEAEEQLSALGSDLDTTWALTCGIFVFLMQVGFCYLESGSVRSTNVVNIVYKNMMDCSISAVAWWAVGYALAFSEGNEFLGTEGQVFFFSPSPSDDLYGKQGHFFLSYTYMTAAATIVSGAVAERISLGAYAAFVVCIASFGYPLVAHWIWSADGWLSPFSSNRILANGCLDFSGSVVIHSFGGSCALIFSTLLGKRKLNGCDVFSEEGQEIVQPHNRFHLAVGTLMLWFSWFAFNAGSVVSMSGGGSLVAANACVTTILASAAATLSGILVSRVMNGYYDVGDACNCALTGLVSITAGCAYVAPVYSLVIGVLSVPVYFGMMWLTRRLKIDDVVSAGAVHWGGGVWGGISVGLFCDADRIRAATQDDTLGEDYGLFLGGGGAQLGVQCIAVLSVSAWCLLLSAVSYAVIHKTIGSRVSEECEYSGIDLHEHRGHSYDYIAGLEKQQAVDVAKKIANRLVEFDLDGAERELGDRVDDSDLVKELKLLFSQLMTNLARYKPFLPESLFNNDETGEEDAHQAEVSPPGMDGFATIVFTDIQASTATWEAEPDAMKEALQLHNRAIRKCIAKCGGYEVKTIGDSFMVAFDEHEAGVLFGLSVLQALYDVGDAWPVELEDLPQSSRGDGWHGLRTRIGLYAGDLNAEMNDITNRYDYTGSTVNKAARLESASVGGALCVTSEFFAMLKTSDFTHHHPVYAIDRSGVTLRGVSGVHDVVLLVPEALSARCSVMRGEKFSIASRCSSKSSLKMGREKKPLAAPSTLNLSRGIVGCVRVVSHDPQKENFLQNFNAALSTISLSLERTDGSINSLSGDQVNVSWNAARRCSSYAESSQHFVALVSAIHTPLLSIYLGLVAGQLSHGKVGTSAQKFVAIFSDAIALCPQVVLAALELNVLCLMTCMPNHPHLYADISHRSKARPVAVWKLNQNAMLTGSQGPRRSIVFGAASIPTTEITLYQLRAEVLKDSEWGKDTEEACETWSASYHHAFVQQDYRSLRKMAAGTRSADVLCAIADQLERNEPLRSSAVVM